jgi:hypothetical protein
MSALDEIEQQIQALSAAELVELRAWFAEFDWEAWDQQLERDVAAGKLDKLAAHALREHASGRTTPF